MQESPFNFFDWFLTANIMGEFGIQASGLAGVGLTIPFPWLHVRVAPAIGIAAYSNRTVDSTIIYQESIWGWQPGDYDTVVFDQASWGLTLGALRALSVSVWPFPDSTRPFTPYLQYQTHWINMSASDSGNEVPDKVINLRGHAFAAGLDYRIGQRISLNTRYVRESLGNGFGSKATNRIESGIAIRFKPESSSPTRR